MSSGEDRPSAARAVSRKKSSKSASREQRRREIFASDSEDDRPGVRLDSSQHSVVAPRAAALDVLPAAVSPSASPKGETVPSREAAPEPPSQQLQQQQPGELAEPRAASSATSSAPKAPVGEADHDPMPSVAPRAAPAPVPAAAAAAAAAAAGEPSESSDRPPPSAVDGASRPPVISRPAPRQALEPVPASPALSHDGGSARTPASASLAVPAGGSPRGDSPPPPPRLALQTAAVSPRSSLAAGGTLPAPLPPPRKHSASANFSHTAPAALSLPPPAVVAPGGPATAAAIVPTANVPPPLPSRCGPHVASPSRANVCDARSQRHWRSGRSCSCSGGGNVTVGLCSVSGSGAPAPRLAYRPRPRLLQELPPAGAQGAHCVACPFFNAAPRRRTAPFRQYPPDGARPPVRGCAWRVAQFAIVNDQVENGLYLLKRFVAFLRKVPPRRREDGRHSSSRRRLAVRRSPPSRTSTRATSPGRPSEH